MLKPPSPCFLNEISNDDGKHNKVELCMPSWEKKNQADEFMKSLRIYSITEFCYPFLCT
jgi:hypothetical protein